MDIMAIAAANINVAALNLQQSTGIAVMEETIDTQTQQNLKVLEMLPPVSFGHQLDIYI